MNEASRTNNILLQILNRMPWRYLYLPGLYLVLLGASNSALLVHFIKTQETASWTVYLLNLLISALFHGAIHFFIIWHFFKDFGDEGFADPQQTQPTLDDAGQRMEDIARSIAESVPWRYAYVPGLSLFLLAFVIVAHAVGLHGKDPGATEWSTVLLVRFFFVVGVAVNVAGAVVCIGWYVFKDIDTNLECPSQTGAMQKN